MTLTRRGLLRQAAALSVGGAAALTAACGEEESDTLSRAREVGVLRIGHANEPPFGYVDDAGRLTGYSVEVARLAFAGLGIARVEGTATEFGGLLSDLGSGAFDVVTAGMYVTPERCRRALFGLPEYCAQQALLVRRGPLERVRGLEPLAGRDVTLGVLGGSAEVELATRAGMHREQLREYPDKDAMRAALARGDVDAVALTSISLRALVRQMPAGRFALTRPFTVTPSPDLPAACGAAAFRRRDARLRDAYDRELRALAKAGKLVPLGRRFGLRAAEIAPDHAFAAGPQC